MRNGGVVREEALYLLRLWRDGDQPEDWRASMEDVRTHQREIFGELAALLAFLEERSFQRAPEESGNSTERT